MTDQELIAGIKALADTCLSMGGCRNVETAKTVIELLAALEARLKQSTH